MQNPVFAIADAKHEALVHMLPHPHANGNIAAWQVPLQARIAAVDAVAHPGVHFHPHHVNAAPQPGMSLVHPQQVQQAPLPGQQFVSAPQTLVYPGQQVGSGVVYHAAPQAVVQHPAMHQYVEVAKTEAFHDIMQHQLHNRLITHHPHPLQTPTDISLEARRAYYRDVFHI
eukprot:762972-Hanusia_phi.AAC.5